MKLSVIYSFFNEEKNLSELIRRTRQTLRQDLQLQVNDYEILFVNDNSKDNSLQVILDTPESNLDIKIINTSRNFGNAQCILAGFAFSKGEYVAYLDSDLQDPPELISEMYKKALNENLDIVHTKRKRRDGEGAFKLLITKIGYGILDRTMSVHMQQNVGDFKLLSRRVVQSVLLLNEPLPFIRGMIAYVGFKEGTLLYNREARFAGETHFPVLSRRVISNFINNALIGYSDLPIYFIIYFSILGLVIALLLSVYMIYIKFTGLAVPGTTSIILTIVTFSSMIILSIGVVGLYLSSIKKAILKRPSWIIESTIENGVLKKNNFS